MLKGKFANCYGIRKLDSLEIDFSKCNKALIYASNGSMKSSLAKVFEDLSNNSRPFDRVFKDHVTTYSITYGLDVYSYDSSQPEENKEATNIYVIKPFADHLEFSRESVTTLLADKTTRERYDAVVSKFKDVVEKVVSQLNATSKLAKNEIERTLIADLEAPETSEWIDIFEKLGDPLLKPMAVPFWEGCEYATLFSQKAIELYKNKDFKTAVGEYTKKLNEVLESNPVLSKTFTDYNAEQLVKGFKSNDLFSAKHTIHLKDGITIIRTADEWKAAVDKQLALICGDPKLGPSFKKIQSLVGKNSDVRKVRETLLAHREIIPYLNDVDALKKQYWLFAIKKLDPSFDAVYQEVNQYTAEIKGLYQEASKQSDKWVKVVDEFNRRFKVPFKILIKNKASLLLKDDEPHIAFEYSSCGEEKVCLNCDDLLNFLSTGEKRALYLLQILFDIERIKDSAKRDGRRYLIVADDIADSFDYKNKYAIIEYLNDIANYESFDLLVLTHNFDFFRTVALRLNVNRLNCLFGSRREDGEISISKFEYFKDFFKKALIAKIKSGKIDNDEKKKYLIASIPFYRNLSEYVLKEKEQNALICYLHLKKDPVDTRRAKLSDLWNCVKPFLGDEDWSGDDELYIDCLKRIANHCAKCDDDDIQLDSKLILSIAVRLSAEVFLEKKAIDNGLECRESDYNQTRDWSNFAKNNKLLEDKEINLIDEVNLITPENIHLNAFMYEPLIDVSAWKLKELYKDISKLL